jgi:hypothetical protein
MGSAGDLYTFWTTCSEVVSSSTLCTNGVPKVHLSFYLNLTKPPPNCKP